MDLLIISPEKELLNVKDIDLVECEGVEGLRKKSIYL